MTLLKIAAMASAAAAFAGLGACNTTSADTGSHPNTGAQAEVDNASNLGSNGSAQPGGAGPSPNGGNSNPGTSGTISPTPGPGPH